MAKPVLDLLQSPPRILDILVFLLKNEEVIVKELMEKLGLSPKTYYAAIDRLLQLGLVFPRDGEGFPHKVFISLTRKGKRVAEGLRPIFEEIEGTLLALRNELEALELKERTEEENKRMLELLLAFMEMEFTVGEWDDAESHARRVLDIASASGDLSSVARSLKLIGEVHHRRHAEDKAEKEFTESLSIHMKLNDLSGASEDHYFLGAIKERKGDWKGALAEFEKSLSLAESSKDEVLKARAAIGTGRVLAQKGNYKESLKRFKESIEAFERLDEVGELPRAYTCAGSSAFYIDIDESIRWHEKCIRLARDLGDVRMLAYGLHSAAGSYIEKKETRKAGQRLKEALKIAGKLDETKLIIDIETQFGILHWREGKWTSSENHFLRAIDSARKNGLTYELADAFLNSGLMNGDRGRTETSKRQLKEALGLFDGLGNQAKMNEVTRALKRLSR